MWFLNYINFVPTINRLTLFIRITYYQNVKYIKIFFNYCNRRMLQKITFFFFNIFNNIWVLLATNVRTGDILVYNLFTYSSYLRSWLFLCKLYPKCVAMLIKCNYIYIIILWPKWIKYTYIFFVLCIYLLISILCHSMFSCFYS